MSTASSSLPPGWSYARIPELISRDGLVTDGDWVETKDQDPQGKVRLTQLADIGDGVFRNRSARFLTEERARALSCTLLAPGDVLVARMPDPLGRACLFPGGDRCCITVVDVCIVRPANHDIDVRWLVHAINSPHFRGLVAEKQSGSTRKRISKANLCTLRLPVPPAREQQRIATVVETQLSRLDAATAALERAQRNLKRYRASVLQAAVEGRLVPTEAELARRERRSYEPASKLLERILVERRRRWIEREAEKARAAAQAKARKQGTSKDALAALETVRAVAARKYVEPAAPDTSGLPELPEGWCWATVEQLASDAPRSIQSGPFGSNLLHSEFRSEGRLAIGIDNVQDGVFSLGSENRISEDKFRELEQYVARPDDVLITVMATVGRCCVVPKDIEPAIITKHVYRVTADRRLIQARFLLLCLVGAPAVRKWVHAEARGQTRPGLNGSIIRRLAVPVAPPEEQVRILEATDQTLSQQDAAVRTFAATTRRCATLGRAILSMAFEGKLVDQDPNDEPASVLLERIKAERAAAEPAKKQALRTAKGKRASRA